MPSKELLKIWEWRGFWPEAADCFSLLPPEQQQAFADARHQSENDIYLSLPDCADGIKCRGDQLEIKSFAGDAVEGCRTFYPKQVTEFPLFAKTVAELFPNHKPPQATLPDIYALASHFDVEAVMVQKSRQKIEVEPGVSLEYCHLLAEGKAYHSLCLEGLNLQDILTEATRFRKDGIMEMDYVHFIRALLA